MSFVAVWRAFRGVLRAAQLTPLDTAAARLPKLFAGTSRLTPFSTPDARTLQAIVVEQIAARGGRAGLAPWAGAGGVAPLVAHTGADAEEVGRQVGDLYRSAFLLGDLRLVAPPSGEAGGEARGEVVALYFVDYVEWVVRHLRRLAFALFATLVLATMLLSSYPFEPQSLVKATLFVLMAASVAAVLAALVQMNRDPVLSAITHTDPGEVTWSAPFVLNLVLVGAVPALTLLGTQFPEVRNFLFSWVTPILRTVGRN